MKKIINKKFVLPILVLFLAGVIFGIVFLFFITDTDKLVIKSEIESYFSLVNSDISRWNGFLSSIKTNFLYITFIWISSITLIFSPISAFIVFYKGFLTGFIISSVIMACGVKGLLISLLMMFPHEVLNILIILIFAIIMISISFKLLKNIYKNNSINLRIFFKKIIIIYFIALLLLIISSVLEVYLNYGLLGIFF